MTMENLSFFDDSYENKKTLIWDTIFTENLKNIKNQF